MLVAMAACGRQDTPPPEEDALYRLECVYQTCPEDPLLILDTINIGVLSAREQAHWCLMKAVLISDNKKYGPEFDSLLQVAKDQYIGSNDQYHETMTYWLIANKTTNLQQPQQGALDALLKARKSIESCRHVDHRLVDFSPEPTDEKTIIEKLKYFILLELGMTYGASIYIADAIPPLKLADAYFS